MKRVITVFLCFTALAAFAVWAPDVRSYEQYSNDRTSGNCAECHGNFRSSPYTSQVDGQSWEDDLHDVHRNTMLNGNCNACHQSSGRFPVSLDSSVGGSGLRPDSCVGCHDGPGLRQHHSTSGENICSDCHSNNENPAGENIPRPYYTTLGINSCNPGGEEDFAGGNIGLDNDGDGIYDTDDPDCSQGPEGDCFDGIDDDADGLTDCGDPDCAGATGGACDTGQPGICGEGTSECQDLAQVCVPFNEPNTEGPFGTSSCSDGMDNDCDGLVDTGDPDCQEITETSCFDGFDDDGDGLTDCGDPDCAGAVDGSCDTGEMGICAAGTLACIQGESSCIRDSDPQPEGPFGTGTCSDGLDNNCDGLTDSADPGCAQQEADVMLTKLRAPSTLKLGSRTVTKRIVAVGSGDTVAQNAEVRLTLVENPVGIIFAMTQAMVTSTVEPDSKTQFKFLVDITCTEPGQKMLMWEATINAPENRDPGNDAIRKTTKVNCR